MSCCLSPCSSSSDSGIGTTTEGNEESSCKKSSSSSDVSAVDSGFYGVLMKELGWCTNPAKIKYVKSAYNPLKFRCFVDYERNANYVFYFSRLDQALKFKNLAEFDKRLGHGTAFTLVNKCQQMIQVSKVPKVTFWTDPFLYDDNNETEGIKGTTKTRHARHILIFQ